MSTPPFRYTTKVAARQTVSELIDFLAGNGAKHVLISYDERTQRPCGLRFMLPRNGVDLSIKLPVNPEAVRRKLVGYGLKGKMASPEHAERVAWRQTLEYVRAAYAFIWTGQKEPAAIFLADLYNENRGATFFELEQRPGGQLALPPPQ